VPCGENNARTESSVAVKGRFPTYNLVILRVLTKNIEQQESPALWLEKLTRVTVIGNETRENCAVPRADKPKDMRSACDSTATRPPVLVIRITS
jgi:hypothetical protein